MTYFTQLKSRKWGVCILPNQYFFIYNRQQIIKVKKIIKRCLYSSLSSSKTACQVHSSLIKKAKVDSKREEGRQLGTNDICQECCWWKKSCATSFQEIYFFFSEKKMTYKRSERDQKSPSFFITQEIGVKEKLCFTESDDIQQFALSYIHLI